MTLQKLNIPPKIDNAAKKQMVQTNAIGANETLLANEVNEIVSKVNEVVDAYNYRAPITAFNYVETRATYNDLPTLGNKVNDAYGIEEDGLVYIWNGVSFPPEGKGMFFNIKPNGKVKFSEVLAVSGDEVFKITSKLVDVVEFWEPIQLTKTPGYYQYLTANFIDASSINSTQLIPCVVGNRFIIDGRCASASMVLVTEFDNSGNYLSFKERGVTNGTNYTNYEYVANHNGFISIAGAVNTTFGSVSKVLQLKTVITPKFPTLQETSSFYAQKINSNYATGRKETSEALVEVTNDLYYEIETPNELIIAVTPSTYYRSNNGSVATTDSSWKTIFLGDLIPGDKYLITGNSRPASTQLLTKFNGSTYVGGEGVGNGTLQGYEDYVYVVEPNVTAIGVTALSTSPIKIKKVNKSIAKKFLSKEENPLKEYGVVINLDNPTQVELTRIKDNFGLNIKVQKEEVPFIEGDTSAVFPLNELRDCNISIDSFGATKITYKGEDDYDQVNEVYVEFPLFYMKRYREGNLEYNLISNYQGEGYFPAPMFVENGKILDKVYIGKYENSLNAEGKVVSSSGKRVLFEKTLSQNRDLIYAKGRGFAPWDYRLTHSLQHLFLVFFANKNSQNLIGGGWTGLHQPWGNASAIQNPAGTYTEIIVAYSASIHLHYYFIGQDVGIIDNVISTHPMIERRVLVDLKLNYPEAGKTTLVLDEAVTIDPAVHLIGGAPQKTGWSDVLEHHTGRTTLKTSRTGTCSVKLFGIENVWGNVWTQIDGAYITNQRIKIGYDLTNFNNLGTNYKPLSYILPIQDTLGVPGDQFGSILNLGIDNANPWVRFAESFGGDANQNNSYGDWYYQYNLAGPYMGGFGGGFDHYERAGLFCDRHWYLYSQTWYLVGSRTQFKMI